MFVEKIFENHELDKNGIGVVWLLATIGNKSTHKRIPKRDIQHIQIPEVCETISSTSSAINPSLTLRLSSNLLYGVSIAYKQKTHYFYIAANNTKLNLQKSALTLTSAMQPSMRGSDKVSSGGYQNFLPLYDILNHDIITVNSNIADSNQNHYSKNRSSKVRYRRKGSKEYFLYDDEAFDVRNGLCPKFDISILNEKDIIDDILLDKNNKRLVSDNGTEDISIISVDSFIEKANKEKDSRLKFRRSDNATIFNARFVDSKGKDTFQDDLDSLREIHKFNVTELEYNETRLEEEDDMPQGFLNLEFDIQGDLRRSDEMQKKAPLDKENEEFQFENIPDNNIADAPRTPPAGSNISGIDIFNFKFDNTLDANQDQENKNTNNYDNAHSNGLLKEILQTVNDETDALNHETTKTVAKNVKKVSKKTRQFRSRIVRDEIIALSNADLQNLKSSFFKNVEQNSIRRTESRFQKFGKEILSIFNASTVKDYASADILPVTKKQLSNWEECNNPVFFNFMKEITDKNKDITKSIQNTEVGLNDIYSTPQQQHTSLEVGRDGQKSHSRSNSGSLRDNFDNFFNVLDQGSIERGRERRNSNNSDPEKSNLPIYGINDFVNDGYDFNESIGPIPGPDDLTNPLDIDLNRAIRGDFDDFDKRRSANRNTSINQSLQDALYSKDIFVTRASLINNKRSRKGTGSSTSSRSNSSSSSIPEGFDRKRLFRSSGNNLIEEEPLFEDSMEDVSSSRAALNKLPLNNIGKNFDELNYGSKAIMQHIYSKIEAHHDDRQGEGKFEDDKITATVIGRDHINKHLLPYFKSRKMFGNSLVMFNFEQLVASNYTFGADIDKKRKFSDMDDEGDDDKNQIHYQEMKRKKKHSCSKAVASNVFSCLLQLATSSIINLQSVQADSGTYSHPCLPTEIKIYANF